MVVMSVCLVCARIESGSRDPESEIRNPETRNSCVKGLGSWGACAGAKRLAGGSGWVLAVAASWLCARVSEVLGSWAHA